MKKWMHIDLTKGTPWKVLLLFSIPIVIGNLIAQFYSWADALMVGRGIDETAFAAIGLAGNLTYIATAFAAGLPSGSSGFSAQLYGAKKLDEVRKSYFASLIICLIAGAVLSIVMEALTEPLLAVAKVKASDAYYDYAKLYIMVIFAGLIGVFFYNFYLNFLRAIGNMSVPFILGIVYAALNIFLDYLFILVFHLGVLGAGLAFDAAVLLASLAGAIWVYHDYPWLRYKKGDLRVPKGFYSEHLRLALPMGLEFVIIGIGVIIMQGSIDSYGQDCINGFYAATKIENLLCVSVCGFGSAMLAYTGQNYGAKLYKRVKDGLSQGLIVMLVDTILKCLITWALFDVTASIFIANPNEETVHYCQVYLIWDLIGYVFLGSIYFARNALLGIGKVVPNFLSGVAELLGRILGAKVFTHAFGAISALGSAAIAWSFSGLLLLGVSVKDIYRNKKFQADVMEERPAETPSSKVL
jgi:putative MATE family efflux protein